MAIYPGVYEFVKVLNQPENADLKAILLSVQSTTSLIANFTPEQWKRLIQLVDPYADGWSYSVFVMFIGTAIGLLSHESEEK